METRIPTPINEGRTVSTHELAEDLKAVLHRAQQQTLERAKATDQMVRAHPYQMIGCALGLGVLIGVLAGRKWGA